MSDLFAPSAEPSAEAPAEASGEPSAEVSGETLDAVREAALACTRCPLAHQGRTQVVFGVGDPHAQLMFVGEGPGAQEDREGEPFVGRAGKLLTQLIEGIGLPRSGVYIANVVKCRPPGNRDPLPDEVAACAPWLDHQIALVQPRVIVTLGNFATKLLLDTKQGITTLRGRPFSFARGGVAATLVPTLHPAAVLRGGGRALAETRADFVVARRLLAQC